jgi:crossover junction endodeoxyribonuclease RuvC
MIMGIDPGASGGIAILSEDEQFVLSMKDKTEADINDWLVDNPKPKMCYLEKVHAMPGQGVTSCFSFGRNYGFLRGLLISRGIPFEDVRPLQWQKYLQCQTKGDKNVTKAKAQQLFPHLKITHAIADSLLIAEYGRRVHV